MYCLCARTYLYVIVCGAGLGGSRACVCTCVCVNDRVNVTDERGGYMVQFLFFKKQERNVKSDQYTAEEVPVPLRPRGTIYENL